MEDSKILALPAFPLGSQPVLYKVPNYSPPSPFPPSGHALSIIVLAALAGVSISDRSAERASGEPRMDLAGSGPGLAEMEGSFWSLLRTWGGKHAGARHVLRPDVRCRQKTASLESFRCHTLECR